MKKILVTGGHPTPAMAVIEELLKAGADVHFVGRKYSMEGDASLSLEYREINRMKIPFYILRTGRYDRSMSVNFFTNGLKILNGVASAFILVRKLRPDKVMSFGGYMALPVCLTAWLMGIPVYTHEQTARPGLANRLIFRLARKIFVSFPETMSGLPADKTILSGNPVRHAIAESKPELFFKTGNWKTLLVLGGSTGSRSINRIIEKNLPQLLSRYRIIHQTGSADNSADFKRLERMRREMPVALADRYLIRTFISDEQIGSAYAAADLAICRGGANTFTELLYLAKPAIIIPLPWSANGEQLEHGRIFEKLGYGIVFSQKRKAEELIAVVDEIAGKLQMYKEKLSNNKLYLNQDAAKIISSGLLG